MSTTTNADFNNMLKDYMPYELLFEELMKRDYFLSKVEKDQSWTNGPLQVAFMGGNASSYSYGELTDIGDITEDRPIRGEVSSYKEIWGTMLFNHRDLDQHGDMAKTFLKILPDRLEDFISRFKEIVSVNLLNGTHFAIFDDANLFNNLAGGILGTDRPARFTVGQYIEAATAGVAPIGVGYVESINIDQKTIHIVVDKALAGADVDFTGLAAGDRFYIRGANAVGPSQAFTALRDQLLSPGNAAPYTGSTNLFGTSKLAYPHLQAPNFNATGVIGDDFLDFIFDKLVETQTLGKGKPTDVIMSYKNLGHAMKALEGGLVGNQSATQGRRYSAGDTKADVFGWTEIQVTGISGSLKLVGVQEMDDDIVYMMDWRSVKLHSNGFFERRTAPDGKQFYETRSASGYQYVIDTRFYGELVVSKPSHCGVLYNVQLV